MTRKAKRGQRSTLSRGLGYLTVIILVAAALVIGAGHQPLIQFINTLLATATPIPTHMPIPTATDIPTSTNITVPVDPQRTESLIHTYTDVTVLAVTVGDSIRIEYLLVPQASMSIESIHNQQMLKLICALRETGPVRRPFIFAGVGRFIDEFDRTALRSRVETKLSTLAFNRTDCASDMPAVDIDWREISEYYKTFAIPDGLALDA